MKEFQNVIAIRKLTGERFEVKCEILAKKRAYDKHKAGTHMLWFLKEDESYQWLERYIGQNYPVNVSEYLAIPIDEDKKLPEKIELDGHWDWSFEENEELANLPPEKLVIYNDKYVGRSVAGCTSDPRKLFSLLFSIEVDDIFYEDTLQVGEDGRKWASLFINVNGKRKYDSYCYAVETAPGSNLFRVADVDEVG